MTLLLEPRIEGVTHHGEREPGLLGGLGSGSLNDRCPGSPRRTVGTSRPQCLKFVPRGNDFDMPSDPLPQALLVVDLQEDFFTDDDLARQREALIVACNSVVEKAQQAEAVVFEIRTIHDADRSSWSLNMLDDDAGMTIESTPGAAAVDGLMTSGATIVRKTRDSAFHNTPLAEKLGDRGITAIAICGVSTESCIAMTAAEAYARDLHVTLVRDALASVDPDAHTHALDRLSRQYRQAITTSGEIEFETCNADPIA